MKQICFVSLVVSACRHGWRCLGGVFASQKLLGQQLAWMLVVVGCFSPWQGDEATITLAIGGSGLSRKLVDRDTEPAGFSYEVIMTGGPGERLQFNFTPGVLLTAKVFPGSWQIEVRAIGDNIYDPSAGFDSRILRALGEWKGTIRSGINSIPIDMYSAAEVTSWAQLDETASDSSGPAPKDADRKEIILVKNNFPANGFSSISILRKIEVRAVEPVMITRGASFMESFFQVELTGDLSLIGPLTLDGGKGTGKTADVALITVSGGELTMYDGVKLQNNKNTDAFIYGGGVHLDDGTFTMYGGEITGNECAPPSGVAAYGGGVHLSDGAFTMYGGTIGNNKAISSGNGAYGGGVEVDYGTFIMRGGTISGNEVNGQPNSRGGGVYTDNCPFTKTGNSVIYGNAGSSSDNKVLHSSTVAASGFGHAVFISGSSKYRDSTAGYGGNLDSSTAGGWGQ